MNTRVLVLLLALFCALSSYKVFVQPLRAIARQELHLAPDQAALLVALAMLAHTLRPLFGLTVDAASRRGIDSRWWLRLAGVLGIVASVVGFSGIRPASRIVAVALTVGCAVMVEVMISAALAAEQARHTSSALLGSARTFVLSIVALLGAVAGGWIAESPALRLVPLLPVMAMVLALASAVRAPRGPAATTEDAPPFEGLLGPVLLGFVFYGIPGFGTLLYYEQVGRLGFSQIMTGGLDAVNNLCGLLGVLVYYRLRGRLSLRAALPVAIVVHALSSEAYLTYPLGWVGEAAGAGTPFLSARAWVAVGVEVVNGLLSAVGFAAISEMAVRSAGTGGAATRMASILGACNIGAALSEWTGSKLSATGHLTLGGIVILHVGCYCLLAVVLRRGAARWFAAREE